MESTETIKKTPLNSIHAQLGGKLVPFAGWELPVRYTELIEEHNAVRNACGLFDVSHMGELIVSGPDALPYLQYLTCNDVSKLYSGKAQYSALLNEQGGVIDDIIVYCFDASNFLICVNASNAEKDYAWCLKQIGKFKVTVQNKSSDYAQLALQGPRALDCLQAVFTRTDSAASLSDLKPFHFIECDSAFGPLIVARTGYTGEDGCEIFINPDQAQKLWVSLMETGKQFGLQPCGLGARDSLRLEACYPLHGHELAENIPALESGLGWIVKFDKGDFIGSAALKQIQEKGLQKKLVGFFVEGPGLVREQTKLFNSDNQEIGVVTSGTLTPTIKKALGLGFVASACANVDSQIFAEVRGKKLPCRIVKTPFYKRPKV